MKMLYSITRAAVTGTAVKADIAGLAGGHSGTEIHKGRANAIALLGRWLTLLTENGVDYAALTLSGGAKENVIPKESSITLVLPASPNWSMPLAPRSSPITASPIKPIRN